MDQRTPPQTEEGWYVLHDCRRVDWDAWRDAPQRARDRALAEGIDFLEGYESVADAAEGQTAVYTVMGHKADLMILHLRPTMADLDAAERHFEQTEFAAYTEQTFSYVSVTEASGYTEKAREYFEGEVDDDSGLAQYIQARLHPDVPDEEFVCFYPMSKRRDPEQNWYDMSFEERAAHIKRHGDIGRGYGGKVNQMICGSIGFDDWEWGITLWSDDMTHIKELLTEMRFDPSTSRFAEFGPFYVGRRFAPADLPAVLAGQRVPTDEADGVPSTATDDQPAHATATDAHATDSGHAADADGHGNVHPGSAGEGDHPHGDDAADADHPTSGESDEDGSSGSTGGRPDVSGDFEEVEDAVGRLGRLGLHEDEAYDAGDYALVFHSAADAEDLVDDVGELAESFDHYDRHVTTTVRAQSGQSYVVSIWTAKEAAETAAGFLSDLDGIEERVGGQLGEPDEADGSDEDDQTAASSQSIREELDAEGVYAGQPHGEDVYALVVYSEADPETLAEEVSGLRDAFDRYDTHVRTTIYEDLDSDTTAVASLWDTEDAAGTASEYLTDLPDVVRRQGESDGFGTMGMFYTVKPDHREDFVAKFDTVGDLLAEMDGHRETALLANRDDANDMFIASQWDSKDDAMAFFRSDEFSETVSWGRDVLADRPRHVFLA
ncbi:heme-binding protein [Haloarcula salinisoli]|uniref:Heme-binding protein n=1 Tax=Haloarcula salinisoli TaxID=2487746 RepID=A0A8J7YFL3_9EURY|nr:heme-binding protein [Halomicroarcula salinisoli]MBX0287663.1 heme-binding protein [Halomicroarcula salinisoli]MBX0304592.1 heme-binding protein [Halomicroarcula salinisoli]